MQPADLSDRAIPGPRRPARRLKLLAAGGLVCLAACHHAVELESFLQGAGPSFAVLNTFGQLIAVSPSQAAHHLGLRLDPADTDVLAPSSGVAYFVGALDGLEDCLVLQPKLRAGGATPPVDLGPDLAKPGRLSLALCNLDRAGGPSPLEAAVQTLYTEAGAADPAAETAEFFDEAVDRDERTVEVWAAPEATFPDPPPEDEPRRWSRLGPAAGGVLYVGAFSEDGDGHRTYLNPAPYLAGIPLAPPPSALRPATFAEIRLEAAADPGFATALRSYGFDLGTGALTPAEPLGGFARVFFRLTGNADDGGATAVAAPHEIAYELRELPAGTVRSHGRFFLNALATGDTVALPDLAEDLGDALYRTPGAGAPESDPATEDLWLSLPVEPGVVEAGDEAPLANLGDLGFDPHFALDVEDGGVRRYPPGAYELDIVLASGFGGAPTDAKTVRFEVAGAPQAQLTAAHAADADEEVPGAPLRLNDDNDNANTYPEPSGVADKRPFEPWLDLAETATVAGEDDLMQLTLDVAPHSLPGDAVLTVPSGGHRVALWSHPDKGGAGDLVAVPADGLRVPVADLPRTLWVEGLETGNARLRLEHTGGTATLEDTVEVHVVRLVERQTWPNRPQCPTCRRVVNRYATDTEFEVEGGTADFAYRWDLNGDGDRATDVFEAGLDSPVRTVRYDTAESATSVRLDRSVENRRRTFAVSVELTGGLVLEKTIRVALDGFFGTALTAGETVPERQAEVVALGAVPVATFDSPPAGDAEVTSSQAWHEAEFGASLDIDAGNRLQYAERLRPGGLTTHNLGVAGLAAGDREVYAVLIGPVLYGFLATREDVAATIRHENLHVDQVVAIRDDAPPGNVWKLLHDAFAGGEEVGGYFTFMEAQAHLSALDDPNVGWFRLLDLGLSDLTFFTLFYNGAVEDLERLPAGPTRTAAEALLRDWYQRLPFEEMKRTDYDETVRPPP